METIVLTLLQLIQTLLPQIGVSSAAVNQILVTLIQIVPLVVKLSQPIIQSVMSVISAMKSSGALTADQLSVLDNLSAEIDAAWQSAMSAYLAAKKPALITASLAPAINGLVAGDPPAPLASAG